MIEESEMFGQHDGDCEKCGKNVWSCSCDEKPTVEKETPMSMTDKTVMNAVSLISSEIPLGYFPVEMKAAIELVVEIARQVVEKKLLPSPPPKLMEHMTEPELSAHLTRQLRFIKGCQSEDTVGSILIIFQRDRITQYGATVDPETVPQALRELADQIEKRETVKR